MQGYRKSFLNIIILVFLCCLLLSCGALGAIGSIAKTVGGLGNHGTQVNATVQAGDQRKRRDVNTYNTTGAPLHVTNGNTNKWFLVVVITLILALISRISNAVIRYKSTRKVLNDDDRSREQE